MRADNWLPGENHGNGDIPDAGMRRDVGAVALDPRIKNSVDCHRIVLLLQKIPTIPVPSGEPDITALPGKPEH